MLIKSISGDFVRREHISKYELLQNDNNAYIIVVTLSNGLQEKLCGHMITSDIDNELMKSAYQDFLYNIENSNLSIIDAYKYFKQSLDDNLKFKKEREKLHENDN